VIRVPRRKAPHGFKERVAAPGKAWLARNKGRRKGLPAYWSRVKDDVIAAFSQRCAYTAMWLSHDGEIDHFVSIDEDPRKAFRWDNLRYAAAWINRSKQNIPSSQLLDPFEVEDGWFEIVLPSLELRVTDRCPVHLRPRAELMLDRLGLRSGPQVMRSRRAFYAQYRSGRAKLEYLDDYAPLIARAIRKQQEAAGATSPPP
jgi:hypothetical protein